MPRIVYTFPGILLFLLFSTPLFSQQRLSGAQPLANINQLKTPYLDNQALHANYSDSEPNRFAVAHDGLNSVTPTTHGTWETLNDGRRLWRLRIIDETAVSLNLGIENYQMPIGGELRIYSSDMSLVHGPYTERHNFSHNQLWTPIIPGKQMIVEVIVPAAKENDLALEFGSVNHGFSPVFGNPEWDYDEHVLDFHVDTACENNPDWRRQMPAVAAYTLRGTFSCSGSLINNTHNDYEPLFLTARHCAPGGQPFGNWQDDAPTTLVFYWNYENSSCRSAHTPQNQHRGDGDLSQATIGGAVLLSQYRSFETEEKQATDHALLRLQKLPDPKYSVYFSGFDARKSDWTHASLVGIHHPTLFEKRISETSGPVARIQDYSYPINGVRYMLAKSAFTIEGWNSGGTEGGSSGSPLFNNEHRIIGSLFGGNVRRDQFVPDTPAGVNSYYQPLYVVWDGCFWDEVCVKDADGKIVSGGYDLDRTQRVKDWLDPDNGSGIVGDTRVWDGLAASFELVGGQLHQDTVGNSNAPVAPTQLVTKRYFWFDAELPLHSFRVKHIAPNLGGNTPSARLYISKGYVPSASDHQFAVDVDNVLGDRVFAPADASPGTWYLVLESTMWSTFDLTLTPTYQLALNQHVSNRGERVYYRLPVAADIDRFDVAISTPTGDFTAIGNQSGTVTPTNADWSITSSSTIDYTIPIPGNDTWSLRVDKTDTSDAYRYNFHVYASEEIYSGDTVSGTIDDPDENGNESVVVYDMNIREGIAEIHFEGTGVYEICARMGHPPADANDCQWVGQIINGEIVFEGLAHGHWYFVLRSPHLTNYTLTPVVTYNLNPGQLFYNQGHKTYYRWRTTGVTDGLQVALTAAGFGEFDIFGKAFVKPSASDNDYAGSSQGNGPYDVIDTDDGYWMFLVEKDPVSLLPHIPYELRVTEIRELVSGEHISRNMAGFNAWEIYRLTAPADTTQLDSELQTRPQQTLFGRFGDVPELSTNAFDFSTTNTNSQFLPAQGDWYFLIENRGAPGQIDFEALIHQEISSGQVRTTPAHRIIYTLDVVGAPVNMFATLLNGHPRTDYVVYANARSLPAENGNFPGNGNEWQVDTGGDEIVDYANPILGRWFFSVVNRSEPTGGYQFQVNLENQPIPLLMDGVTTRGDTPSPSGEAYYKMVTPAGTLDMHVELDKIGYGDDDFYARFNALPDTNTYDWSLTSSGDENGTRATPATGVWYFLVDRYSGSYDDFDITVSLTDSADIPELQNGITHYDYLNYYDNEYYRIDVPKNARNLHAVLNIPYGQDYELYGRLNALPTTGTYDYRGTASGGENINYATPGAGTWYFMVDYYSGGSGNYDVTVSFDRETGHLLFSDNFETDRGWFTNLQGDDSANKGHWQRANPQSTYAYWDYYYGYYGPRQLGTTTSGDYALVTAGRSGYNVGDYDVDEGITSITSPEINLPAIHSNEQITLNLDYYFAHSDNAGPSDYFAITVIGNLHSRVVYKEQANDYDRDAQWQTLSINLSEFSDQRIQLKIEAADNYYPHSLIEAAVDDIEIRFGNIPADNNMLLNNTFNQGLNDWTVWSDTEGPSIFNAEHRYVDANINDGDGNVWDVGIRQENLNIEKDKRYQVRFKAKADGVRSIQVQVEENQPPWTNYSNHETFHLNPNWSDYSFEFTMDYAADNQAQLEFDLGYYDKGVAIKDVYLELIP